MLYFLADSGESLTKMLQYPSIHTGYSAGGDIGCHDDNPQTLPVIKKLASRKLCF